MATTRESIVHPCENCTRLRHGEVESSHRAQQSGPRPWFYLCEPCAHAFNAQAFIPAERLTGHEVEETQTTVTVPIETLRTLLDGWARITAYDYTTAITAEADDAYDTLRDLLPPEDEA